MNKKVPLRARKKAQLRQALISASFKLFNRKGYTATTLEEISEACDVTVQTLLRYFGSKDDLIFGGHPALLEKVRTGLARAAKTKSSAQYWLKFMLANTLKLRTEREVANTYKIIVGAPVLLSRFHAIVRQYELIVEQALSEEVGLNAGEDTYSTLLAHLLVTATIEDALRLIARGKMELLSGHCIAVAEYALENLQRPQKQGRRQAKKF